MEDFFESLEQHAKHFPGAIALASVSSRSGFMTYEEFFGNILSATAAASRQKIGPGQLVVLAGANPDAQFIIALALMRLGCRVGYHPDAGLYDDVGVSVDAVIADAPVPDSAHRIVTIGNDWFKGTESLGLRHPPPPDDYSVIFSSSGSTGTPKLIEYGRKALMHRVSAQKHSRDYGHKPRFLSAMGDRTAAHFFNTLCALLLGGTTIGPTHRDPATILSTIELFRPSYVLMPPSTLVDVVRRLGDERMDFEKVPIVRAPGARSVPELQQKALERLTEKFISFYGSTETGGIASGYTEDVCRIDRCVGRVMDGLDVAAFSPAGERLPPGTEGEIRVKGPEGTFGKYIGDYGQQPSAFKDGWFATGDWGAVDEDRNLIIVGRMSNVINIGGTKISPEVVEDELRAFSQVKDVGVAGVCRPEGFEWVCAAIVTSAKLTVDDVNAHLRRRKAPMVVDLVRIVPAIPKTGSGKIDRVALRQLCSAPVEARLIGNR